MAKTDGEPFRSLRFVKKKKDAPTNKDQPDKMSKTPKQSD